MQLLVSIALPLIALVSFTNTQAEIESIDLKALAKKARPAVMLLVVSDADGKEIATGTGFLVSSDGKLITNHHVIEGAASAVAKTENGGLYPVEGVLVDDPKNDLVLLKLKGKDLPFLTFGNSEKIEVGTRIAVIGSPLGLEGTLSEGIVSAERELMGDVKRLQITAAISPGSSGSPVMNSKGDVVGIASSLLTGGQALNFAVPVEYGVRLLAKVKPSSIPQSISETTNASGEDAIFADPNWRASVAAEAAGDYVEMLKHSKALVARYPDDASAWYGLGTTFGYMNFIDDAIAAYHQAIKIKPEDAPAWNNLGMAYDKSGRIDDAIVAYRRAIKIKPDFDLAWDNLADMYRHSGRTDEAIVAYRQAIKLKPDYAMAWNNLGGIYSSSGHTDEAIVAYRQAIKLKPDFAMAWCNLGIIYSDSHRTDDAIAAYHEAVNIEPDYADAWLNLGVAYGNSGRTEDEIAAYRQAIKIRPDYALAWNNLGVSLRDSGRTNEAHDAFQQARSLKR